MPNRAEVAFDAPKLKPLDVAVDALMAEMERVLRRRSYYSYVDDRSDKPADLRPTAATQWPPTRWPSQYVYPISDLEVEQSNQEVRRVVGQINKARARLGRLAPHK